MQDEEEHLEEAIREIEDSNSLFVHEGRRTTLLHVFAEKGDVAAARFLLHNGNACACLPDDSGRTPFHVACEKGHMGVCKIFLDAFGAPNGVRDRRGRTPLHEAAERGLWDICELLLGYETDPDEKDEGGATPLLLACRNGHTVAAKSLLDHHARQDPDGSGATPLHEAAKLGRTDLAKFLLRFEAPPHAPDARGFSPLALAASGGFTELCEVLIDAGAPLRSTDPLYPSPLHAAAAAGRVAVCRFLVERGAPLDTVYPLVEAVVADHADVFEFLLSKMETSTTPQMCASLVAAAEFGRLSMCERLLERGVPPQADFKGARPLHHAAAFGRVAICKLLIERGAGVEDLTDQGFTPLALAVSRGKEEAALFLIRTAKARVEYVYPCRRETLLHRAASTNMEEVCRLLLRLKAPYRTRDSQLSPLHLAAQMGFSNICDLFLSAGVDADEKTADGHTALELAVQQKKWKTADLISRRSVARSRVPACASVFCSFET